MMLGGGKLHRGISVNEIMMFECFLTGMTWKRKGLKEWDTYVDTNVQLAIWGYICFWPYFESQWGPIFGHQMLAIWGDLCLKAYIILHPTDSHFIYKISQTHFWLSYSFNIFRLHLIFATNVFQCFLNIFWSTYFQCFVSWRSVHNSTTYWMDCTSITHRLFY